MNTKSTLGKTNELNKRSRLLVTALVALSTGTAASLFVGCGVAKSGFSTDPFAGKGDYKQMQAKGVPQVGAPNQIEVVEVDPPGYKKPAAPTQVAQVSAPTVADVEEAAATAAEPVAPVAEKNTQAPVVEIALPEVPLPETNVLTFVENEAVVYRFKIAGLKGKASMKNLIKGMIFSASDDQSNDVYDLKWSPTAGAAGATGSKLASVKLNAGAGREHLLIVSVVKDSNRPTVEKVSLKGNSINQGESMAIRITFSDASNAAATSFKVTAKAEGKSSAAIKSIVDQVRTNAVTKVDANFFEAELLVDTKDAKLGAKDSHVRFFVNIEQGERVSASIPVSIKLNKKAGPKKAGGKK